MCRSRRPGWEHLTGSLLLCIASSPLLTNKRRRRLQANLLMGARILAGVIYKVASVLQSLSTVIQQQQLQEISVCWS